VFQPAVCTLVDTAKKIIRIKNWSSVRSLDYYKVTLDVLDDGKIISQKNLPSINVQPFKDTLFSLAPYLPVMKRGHEYLADIHFSLPENEPWANKGYEIAADQFAFGHVPSVKNTLKHYPSVLLTETPDAYVINGRNFTIGISKKNGSLNSYLINDQQQVFAPLLPHFTRPLTDNDRRGWKANKVLKPWYKDTARFKTLVAKRLAKDLIKVTSTYTLIQDSARVLVTYLINGEGVIKINYILTTTPGLPDIPEVGMQCGIKRSYDNISWYGRGPYGNYIDRRTGSEAGIYNQPIEQFNEPYVVPQETGNRTDVRWMFLSDKKSDGLLVTTDSLLSMNAWPYTEKNINTARHTDKLVDPGFITLNIDLIQMGVGGNDSWSPVGEPIKKYRVPARNYSYNFYLFPCKTSAEKAGAVSANIKFKSAGL
ncbi:MAG: DUF4981 domain-containing protein, partial [Bacteroidetes bacterium]|nr:DUF4981 domain-containing protein [Bacteroidota bacterium]